MMTTTKEAREARIAVDRIVGFAKQFGEEHLNLACHAAFPLALTPDLLYQIWANFVPRSPWTAVARVLLSRLCKDVGYEMYEMDIAVRNLLLKELKEQFGQKRFEELADFLMEYVAQRLNDDDPDTQDLAQAQKWTALAYTKPSEAARKLAEALSLMVKQEDMAEVFRLASLVETFAEPLKAEGFEPLLIYSGGMVSFVRGDLEEAKAQFGKLPRQDGQLQVAGVNLDIPVQVADVSLDIPRDMFYPGLLLQNRYRVDRLLSRTMFFETWQVDDNGTPKVLKVLLNNYLKLSELFKREAYALQELNHPGIPKVESDGYFTFRPERATEPLHCLVMEFIEGQNLHEWLEQPNNQPITQEQALDWLKQLVEILAQVHEQKYYHWEIKPSNIIRRPDGQLVLINFGTARDVIDSYVARLKRQEVTMIASVGYTPPEQFRSQAVPQSDFFALGRTFVYLLTGNPPMYFEEYPETFQLNWRDRAPQVSKSLANLIDDLMAPLPNNRPQNAQEILQRIANLYREDSVRSHLKELPQPLKLLAEPILKLGRQLWEQKEQKTRVPKIGLYGRSGSGKSSLINAIMQKRVAEINDVKPGTLAPTTYDKEHNGLKLTFVDSRGVGDALYEDAYNQAINYIVNERIDVLLFVIPANDRAYVDDDIRFLKALKKEHQKKHHTELPVILVINKIDLMPPMGEWKPPYNLNLESQTASTLKEAKIHECIQFRIEQYKKLTNRYVPVCALWNEYGDDRRYNIDELAQKIYDCIPDEAKPGFAGAATAMFYSDSV